MMGCHFNAMPWQHLQMMLRVWLLACTMLGQICAIAQTPLEVGPNTTIFFTDKLNSLVLEDQTGSATVKDVMQRIQEFQPADSLSAVRPSSHYWVAQRLINRLGEDREIVVNAFVNKEGIHWLQYQHFVIDTQGHVKELNGFGQLGGTLRGKGRAVEGLSIGFVRHSNSQALPTLGLYNPGCKPSP